jgi:CCT motif
MMLISQPLKHLANYPSICFFLNKRNPCEIEFNLTIELNFQANIDLSLEGGPNGIREASVMRYKEKRRTRLFSKKIRYQVRKVNADQRPRMKASVRF